MSLRDLIRDAWIHVRIPKEMKAELVVWAAEIKKEGKIRLTISDLVLVIIDNAIDAKKNQKGERIKL